MRFLFIILSLSILFSCENQNDEYEIIEKEPKLGNPYTDTDKFFPPPQNIKGLIIHINKYYDEWVLLLRNKYPNLSIADASKYIDKSLETAKKIDNGTIKHAGLYKKLSDGSLGYQVIPEVNGLRVIILTAYKEKFPVEYNILLEKVKEHARESATEVKNERTQSEVEE